MAAPEGADGAWTALDADPPQGSPRVTRTGTLPAVPSPDGLMDDPLAAATEALVFATWALVLIGAVQLVVNVLLWHANRKVAGAAAQNADIAAKDFRLSRRPAVMISWSVYSVDAAGPEPGVIEGTVREMRNGFAILHRLRTRIIPNEPGELQPPLDATGFSSEWLDLNKPLKGDRLTHKFTELSPCLSAIGGLEVVLLVSGDGETMKGFRGCCVLTFVDGKPELMKGDTTGIADEYLADFFPSHQPPKQPPRDYGQREADALSRAWTGGLGDA